MKSVEIDLTSTPLAQSKAINDLIGHAAFAELALARKHWWERFNSANEFARFVASIGNHDFVTRLQPIFPDLIVPNYEARRASKADATLRKREQRAMKRIRAKQKLLKN